MRGKNYRLQDGCHNCKFVDRVAVAFETYPMCIFGEDIRKDIYSVGTDLEIYDDNDEEWEKEYQAYRKIQEKRETYNWGVCDSWEKFNKQENKGK